MCLIFSLVSILPLARSMAPMQLHGGVTNSGQASRLGDHARSQPSMRSSGTSKTRWCMRCQITSSDMATPPSIRGLCLSPASQRLARSQTVSPMPCGKTLAIAMHQVMTTSQHPDCRHFLSTAKEFTCNPYFTFSQSSMLHVRRPIIADQSQRPLIKRLMCGGTNQQRSGCSHIGCILC